jgi:DNA polymerase IV
MNKPNGFTLITPDKAEELVGSLDIGKFHGIGKVTAAKMQSMGILTGADMRERSEEELVRHFGKTGRYYYRIARAQDDRDVQPHRIRKSIGSERTFETDLAEEEAMLEQLLYLAKEVSQDMERLKATARTVTLKIKYFDFTLNTRSKTFLSEFSAEDAIFTVARDLLRTPQLPQYPVRLLGISVSSLLYQHDRLQEGYQFTLEF